MDNDSHGWRRCNDRPNIECIPVDQDETEGLRFIGAHVKNNDENLERLVLFGVTWSGSGPDRMQGTIPNAHVCNPDVNMQTWPFGKLHLAGLVHKAQPIKGVELQLRESHGHWSTQVPANLDVSLSGNGGPDPTIADHRNYSWWLTNSHRTAMRVARIVVHY